MNDQLKAWLSPLVAEAKKREVNLSQELQEAGKPIEGQLFTPTNWVLFGQLVIRRLGWEGTYPEAPDSGGRSQKRPAPLR